MNYFYTFIIVILCVLIFYKIFWNNDDEYKTIHRDQLVLIRSEIDGNYYTIQKNKLDKQEAANNLGELNLRIIKIINYLYLNINNYNNREKYYIKNLRNRYSYKNISEAVDEPRLTSYIINKKNIYLCLRQRTEYNNWIETKEFVDINTLMFVLLHELSHLSMDKVISEKEHKTDKDFTSSFNLLLNTAENLKLYDKKSIVSGSQYCGLKI